MLLMAGMTAIWIYIISCNRHLSSSWVSDSIFILYFLRKNYDLLEVPDEDVGLQFLFPNFHRLPSSFFVPFLPSFPVAKVINRRDIH